MSWEVRFTFCINLSVIESAFSRIDRLIVHSFEVLPKSPLGERISTAQRSANTSPSACPRTTYVLTLSSIVYFQRDTGDTIVHLSLYDFIFENLKNSSLLNQELERMASSDEASWEDGDASSSSSPLDDQNALEDGEHPVPQRTLFSCDNMPSLACDNMPNIGRYVERAVPASRAEGGFRLTCM
jgi:hypothetical protein